MTQTQHRIDQEIKHLWQHSPLAKQLNISLPLIQAPMAGGATTAELIAAVSNAGGLGCLGAGYMSADQIKKTIDHIRQLTHQPFGVNLFIPESYQLDPAKAKKILEAINHIGKKTLGVTTVLPTAPYAPSFDAQIEVIIEEKIPVFSFTFGLLEKKYRDKLKQNQTLLVGTATSVQEAQALEAENIDVISAQSAEAGGHRGSFIGDPLSPQSLMTNHQLISSLKHSLNQKNKTPIIAAGGVMDSADIIDRLKLGADGVQMGTAFLTIKESGIHPAYKQALLNTKQDNTELTKLFSGKYARGIINQFITELDFVKNNCLDYPIQNALTQIIRNAAKQSNNSEFMSLWAGKSASKCQDISAAELITQLNHGVLSC